MYKDYSQKNQTFDYKNLNAFLKFQIGSLNSEKGVKEWFHQKGLSAHLTKAMKYGRIIGSKQKGQNGYVFSLPD